MRFGVIHRIMTDALAVLGLLALTTSGELNRWISGAILIGMVVALFIPERYQDHGFMRRLGFTAPLLLLTVQTTRLFLGGSILSIAVEFAAALQVVRLATRRGAAHDQQVIVLALLHLIAGTVLGGGLAYGMCFLGFLVVAPGALVLSHLRREVEGNYRQGARDRTGLPVDVPRILRSRRVIGKNFLVATCLLSIPIFLFTAMLFVLFPRVGLSLLLLNHSRPERMIGFSDRVDLGGVGKLRSDPTIAMRVDIPDLPAEPPPRLALYLRGTAFDQYDGRAWSRSKKLRIAADSHGSNVRIRRFPNPAADRTIIIDLEPIEPPVLFLPPDAVALKLMPRGTPLLGGGPTVLRGPEDELKYASLDDRGLRYEVFLAGKDEAPPPRLSADDRDRYLRLPADVTPRIRQLARSWTGGAKTDFETAKRLEERLRTDYKYDLESPSGATDNPLDHFLFDSKRGHCEFYSTAMAVMLRSVGIPTRNVTGFIGGTYNRFGGFYAVRQGDAHSWVEVYIERRGWTRFDPTPPSDAAPRSEISGVLAFMRDLVEASAQRWNRHVVGYDFKQQVSLFRNVKNRYATLKSRSDVLSALSPQRAAILLIGLALVIGGVVWIRRNRKKDPGKGAPTEQTERDARRAAELYRALESVMLRLGVPRVPSTPPLAHARALDEMGHPAADTIVSLTQMYIDARFGGKPLTEEQRTRFLDQTRELKRSGRVVEAKAA